MLKEAISYLRELGNAAHFKLTLDEVEQKVFLNDVTGEVVLVEKDPPRCGASVLDLSSLILFVNRSEELVQKNTCVFVSETEVTAVLDYVGGHASSRISLKLHPSPVFKWLDQSHSGSPKDITGSIRYFLSSAGISPEDLAQRLSVLKFETQSEESHQIRPKDEGVSRSMRSKVTGESEIPTQAAVSFIVYPDINEDMELRNSDTEVTVELEIQVDPETSQILLRPFPGSLRGGMLCALKNIQDVLVDAIPGISGRVYLGKP